MNERRPLADEDKRPSQQPSQKDVLNIREFLEADFSEERRLYDRLGRRRPQPKAQGGID